MFGLNKIGMPELLIILAIMLLIFGGRKIPEIARSIGKSLKEIKNAKASLEEEVNKEENKENKS